MKKALIAVLVLAALAAALIYVAKRREVQAPAATATTAITPAESDTPKASDTGAASGSTAAQGSGATTYASEAGFNVQYPSGWTVTSDLKSGLLVRVVNPARAGKPDTDTPIEQFLVRSIDIPCPGKAATFAGISAIDSGWFKDSLAGTLSRSICFRMNEKPTQLLATALDENTQAKMDALIASFEFSAQQ